MNIIFAGTPEIAAHCLQALLDSHHTIVSVYTQPDRPKGRGKKLAESPVKQLAKQHGLTIHQPEKCRELTETADVMVVVAYGCILPQAVLSHSKYGCINVHTSLLPKYRGAAPTTRAILNGEHETGVSIMQLDKGCDTGPVYLQVPCSIDDTDTTETLLNKQAKIGAQALLEALNQIETRSATLAEQDHSQATYAHKINKEEGLIDWHQSAEQIARQVRALQPWPVAYTHLKGEALRIYQATVLNNPFQQPPGTIISVSKKGIDIATGKQVLRCQTLQLPGKKAMDVASILNGHPDLFEVGMKFDVN